MESQGRNYGDVVPDQGLRESAAAAGAAGEGDGGGVDSNWAVPHGGDSVTDARRTAGSTNGESAPGRQPGEPTAEESKRMDDEDLAYSAAAAAAGRAAIHDGGLWESSGDSVTYPRSPAWVDDAIEEALARSAT